MDEDVFKELVSFIRDVFDTNDFIPLHEPRFLSKEREYINDAIDSTFVSSVGKYVDRFEEQIAEKVGANYAVATSNGTSALHIALLMAKVEKNSLVITQPLTFVATANAISYTGASPLFIDVDRDTMGMSPDALRKFLTEEVEMKNDIPHHKASGKKVSACLPMHTFGFPCRIDQIRELCEAYHLPLIEDAAESLGSTYKGQYTGTFGDIGVYSFNGNKTITCGGGGILVMNDKLLAKKAKHITTTAKVPHKWEYVHDAVGYNYRMPNLNAAMACAQLEVLDAFIENKRDLAKKYAEFLEDKPIGFISEGPGSYSNYWLMCVLLEDFEQRENFLEFTNNSGVMTRPIWRLMTKLDMYANCYAYDLKNAEWLEDRIVNIPSSVRPLALQF